MCGEQLLRNPRLNAVLGSPPRVRGTAAAVRYPFQVIRITPACAGNSSSTTRRWSPGRDHPRVCGEQRSTMTLQTYRLGSPPRVRGTVGYGEGINQLTRITPACAGNSALR